MHMLKDRRAKLILFVLFICSCEGSYVPKPKGYNRIDLPQHSYMATPDTLPYRFEYSEAATLERHKSPMATKNWIDLKYYDLGGEIQLTYLPIRNGEKDLISMVNDAFRLASKHQVKASGIERAEIKVDSITSATIFKLQGEVPSQFQFFATDSSNHFLRGALYFRTSTKNDSLEPVIDFIGEDMLHMINTLSWKDQ